MIYCRNNKGFSLLEMVTVTAVIVLVALLARPAIGPLVQSIQLGSVANRIKHQLICTKTRALGDSKLHCGVYFDTSSTPHRIQTFFDDGVPVNNGLYDQGSDTKYMAEFVFPPTISLSIGGAGMSEVIIFRGDGSTRIHGMVLSISTKHEKKKIISVLPSTGRIKIMDP